MATWIVPALTIALAILLALPAPLVEATHEDDRRATHRWVETAHTLTLSRSLERLELDGEVHIHEINATPELGPWCGASCTADEVRALYRRLPEAQRGELVKGIEDAVALEAFRALAALSDRPDQVAVTARVVNSSLEAEEGGSPYAPSVRVTLVGTGPSGPTDAGADVEEVEALFAMGARVTVPIAVTVPPGENLTLSFAVDEPLAVLDPGDGALADDNRSVTWSTANWNGERRRELLGAARIGRPDVMVPERPRALVNITLDLSDMEGRVAQLLRGSEYAVIHARLVVNGTFHAFAMPGVLPAGVELPALSADAVRIGIDAGLIDPALLEAREAQAREQVAQVFEQTFGVEEPVAGGFVNESLDQQVVGGPLRLVLEANTTLFYPPRADANGTTPALTLSEVPLPPLQLPQIPGIGPHVVRLTIVVPDGTHLRYGRVENGELVETTDDEGHKAYVLQRNGTGGPQPTLHGAALVVDAPAVWYLFWPWIVGVLAVVAIVALVTARRRRGRGERPS